MRKILSFLALILISTLIFSGALILYDLASRSRPAAQKESLDQALLKVIASDEWVLAKGYYSAVIYDSGGPDKKPLAYVEGVVRAGIKIRELEMNPAGAELTILYPAPRVLGVDLSKHLNFSEKPDRDLYNAALLEAKPALMKEALKEGILAEAEQRLRTELPALAQDLAAATSVTFGKKGPGP